MLFNSWSFLVFFILVTVSYFASPHRVRWIILLFASCAFYMAFVPVYILVLAATIIFDFIAAIQIEKHNGGKRTIWLWSSIAFTCLILFFFKYYDFFVWNVNETASFFHSDFALSTLKLILPIGLSFHTFQSLSYVIEVHRGNQKAERHLGIYSLFVMFYPQLVAGPIERPQNLLHQFHEDHPLEYNNVTSGLRLMAWGLFKKAVIADRLSLFVSPVYDHPDHYNGGILLIATLFFSFQIFCDFSGYSDMARGAARVMGINLMINFDRPYSATSLSDFWRRWHISLSTWLRDYVYEPISLGLRDWGKIGIAIALIVTFLISGIWHGANWTFVTWGLLYGLGMTFEVMVAKKRKSLSRKIPSILFNGIMLFITFAFVNFSYIFFRAQSMHDAFTILSKLYHWIFPLNRLLYVNIPELIHTAPSAIVAARTFFESCLLISALVTIHYLQSRWNIGELIVKSPWWVRWPTYQIAMLSIAFMGIWLERKSFIYFQF